MKMLCIKDGEWKEPGLTEGPKYMEEVTKVDDWDEDFLILAEYPFPEVFHRKWFIPLSNIDETEMVRENQLVKV